MDRKFGQSFDRFADCCMDAGTIVQEENMFLVKLVIYSLKTKIISRYGGILK